MTSFITSLQISNGGVRVLRERAAGWQVVLLSPDPSLDRQLGFPVTTVASTSNGGIPVRVIRGVVD